MTFFNEIEYFRQKNENNLVDKNYVFMYYLIFFFYFTIIHIKTPHCYSTT